jgi:hypothetical protein
MKRSQQPGLGSLAVSATLSGALTALASEPGPRATIRSKAQSTKCGQAAVWIDEKLNHRGHAEEAERR